MNFETEKIEMTQLNFETEMDENKNIEDSSLELKVVNFTDEDSDKEKILIKATTVTHYKDDKFFITATFIGHFILEDVNQHALEKNKSMQEELGKKVIEKIFNKLNMYVSILSQEIYNIPIYPAKVKINLNF